MAQERTEEPTPKKLRDVRRKGQVAASRELGTAAVLLSVAAALSLSGATALEAFQAVFALVVDRVASGGAFAPAAVLGAGAHFGLEATLPVLFFTLLAGTLASFVQVGPLFTLEPLVPKGERLDPVRGMKNLVSPRKVVELFKTLVKMGLVFAISGFLLRDAVRGVSALSTRGPSAALEASTTLVTTLFVRVGVALMGIAVLDVIYQRWRFRKEHRMTKEEVKREHRETEGEPHVKQERRRAHREILEHAVLEEVRRADVLVVNPTRLAIALRYDEDAHQAPEVTAKGQEGLARRMIDAAQRAGVPIMRDVPLARALYELETGTEIPEVLYEAVAAVLRAAEQEFREGSERA